MKSKLFPLLIFVFTPLSFCFGQTSVGSGNSVVPTYKVSVDAKLYSHFIDRGLSISDKNPALNASFLFNLGPQFPVGFWGSNISNISSPDDNFWFKFLADVRVDFSTTTNLIFYLHDDHFYKSSVRNGQRAGFKFNSGLYMAEAEWMNNFEGSHTDGEYFNFGKLFDFRQSLRLGGKLGYTLQHAAGLDNYFDAKVLALYEFNKNASFEVGATAITNENQFNGRGEPGFYISIALSY